MTSFMPYYKRDGTPISIDLSTDQGLADMKQIMDADNRRVALDHVGEVQISTVFLAINHAWNTGEPILFETMVFGYDDGDDQYQWRYRNEDEAIAGHATILEAVKQGTLTQGTLS